MKKYYSIELLRFFSALAVLFYHYRHFFNPFNSINETNYNLIQNTLPFFNFLEVFYDKGFYGVHLFYAISGFVFTYIYCSSNKNTTAKSFFLNRFARLYPLHFVTLLVVAMLQIVSYFSLGDFQIFEFNDLYHFALQIFFISSWGFESGHSFNGPIWSVSIEIGIYIIFFILLNVLKKYKIHFTIIICMLLLIISKLFDSENLFLQCARLFFSGSLIFFISQYKKFYKILALLSIILLAFSFYGNFKIYLFCPSILLLFITVEKYLNNESIKFIFTKLGNLTYAIYLLHIPLQLLILLFFNYLGITEDIFLKDYFFIVFIFCLLILSNLCFQYFEKPLNKTIRNKLS